MHHVLEWKPDLGAQCAEDVLYGLTYVCGQNATNATNSAKLVAKVRLRGAQARRPTLSILLGDPYQLPST